MNYDQVDAAISFLYTDEVDLIVLQVPYHTDIDLVKDYIIRNYGSPTECCLNKLVFYKKVIKFEVIGKEDTGFGYRPGQLFFIDRAKDRTYYVDLEVVP